LAIRADQQMERKRFIHFGEWETMDTEPARTALSPKRLAWAENVLIVAPNDLRVVPGPGETLATIAGETITSAFYASFNDADYIVCFTQSGKGYTVKTSDGSITNFAGAGTFSANPDVAQWQSERILIADPTAGYCTYDGSLFVKEGMVSPNISVTSGGEGYSSAPTVTISGGSGAGATAVAEIENGSVVRVKLTNAGSGYAFDDILKVSFSGGNPSPGGVLSVTVLDGGHDYRTAPTVTISAPAGGGTTATATAQVTLGRVVSITVTNMGTGYKETPTITITPAGADINAGGAVAVAVMSTVASATARIWPFTLKPRTLAVYQGRVWYASGRELRYTGLTGYDDVDSANAAGTTILSDADVVHEIVKLSSANNFLYIVCDKSIKQIGSISVSNSITQFTITSLSSDQGTTHGRSVRSFNRLLMLANGTGIFALFGASVEKISQPMSGIFEKIDLSQPIVADVFDFYGRHVLLVLVRYDDPSAGSRPLLLAYYDRRWSVISQGSMSIIVTAQIEAGNRIYAISGGTISRILADEDAAVNVTVKTSLWHNNEPVLNKRAIRLGIGQTSSETNLISVSVDSEGSSSILSITGSNRVVWINGLGDDVQWRSLSGDLFFTVAGYAYADASVVQSGIFLGITVSGSLRKYRLNNLSLEYVHGALFKSRNV